MFKTANLQKKKVFLIMLAILILCGVISLIVFFCMDNVETPNKAVYVYELEQL
ncbi:hypothetical protein EHE19_005235 [Ruminiclostridium herbifermentans]|uniref:Uncharacterized protein n=1 Tax=Ruminiclostridium herbifermentans TaxID=2488810 RepID=A0A7H1VR44_9FIRM|nr:hypothetical protein [Ruminiclostridium herbifermentans]QNU67856.1 hypothetical protein EHE19_005235 [Ruminiclostridium herbifermentans]